MEALLAFLKRSSHALSIVVLLAVCGGCVALFNVRSAALVRHAARVGPECQAATLESPDSRIGGYNAATLDALFTCWGQPGRELYVKTQLSLDLFFPLAYGLLFGLLILNLARAGQERLVLVPLLTVIADLGENLLLAGLAWRGPPVAEAWARAASAFTSLKFALFAASLAFIAVLAVLRRIGCLRARSG